jgi:hypothetical protein
MAADLTAVFFSPQFMLLQLPPERDPADAEDLGSDVPARLVQGPLPTALFRATYDLRKAAKVPMILPLAFSLPWGYVFDR